jgi:hypothetical protein
MSESPKERATKRLALVAKIKDAADHAVIIDGLEFNDIMEAIGDSISEIASEYRSMLIELKGWAQSDALAKDSE